MTKIKIVEIGGVNRTKESILAALAQIAPGMPWCKDNRGHSCALEPLDVRNRKAMNWLAEYLLNNSNNTEVGTIAEIMVALQNQPGFDCSQWNYVGTEIRQGSFSLKNG